MGRRTSKFCSVMIPNPWSIPSGVKLTPSLIVMMNGHGCSGKTTLAREIARSLRLRCYECSLLSYDDVRASIQKTLGSSLTDRGLLDDVAYRILLRVASNCYGEFNHVNLQAIVLDSPLSSRGHLDQVLNLPGRFISEPVFLVVECQPEDEVMWRQWSESRIARAAVEEAEPSPSDEVQMEISKHKEYCMDGTLCRTVDTTESEKFPQGHAEDVIDWITSYRADPVILYPNLTMEEHRSGGQPSWRHFSHGHSLFYYPQHVVGPNDEEAAGICTLCRDAPSGAVYGCSWCGFYLHESCAQLPQTINFGRRKFVLKPSSGGGIDETNECLICYGQSGVLYGFAAVANAYGDFRCQIHPNCAQLPHKLKHSSHKHPLELKILYNVCNCCACGTYGNVGAYYCKACNLHFHLMCTLYLETRVVHERHWHPLLLCTIPRDDTNVDYTNVDDTDVDDTDEYYCEICATARHPDLWAYYCKPCKYEAHLSCVNPQINPCNPKLLWPENSGELGSLTIYLWDDSYEVVRNPILIEISGSKMAWETVEDYSEEEPVEDDDND